MRLFRLVSEIWAYCFSSSLRILFPLRTSHFEQVDDTRSNNYNWLLPVQRGLEVLCILPGPLPREPLAAQSPQADAAIADRAAALEEREISTEFILQSSGAQFFSRILVRSSFSRLTIGLGSSFSPAAIMAFS